MMSKELVYFQILLFADILLCVSFFKGRFNLSAINSNKQTYLTPFILDTGETGILASMKYRIFIKTKLNIQNEPVHEISNNVVCATSKASDQPAHTRSLIRAFASRLSIL